MTSKGMLSCKKVCDVIKVWKANHDVKTCAINKKGSHDVKKYGKYVLMSTSTPLCQEVRRAWHQQEASRPDSSAIYIGFLATENLPNVSFQTLLKITHVGSRKSYLVITCPNAYEKLTKSEIRSNLSRFKHCSKSFMQPIGSHYRSLFAPIHMKSWTKSKLGKIGVGLNIAQNHSSSLQEVLPVHYLPHITCKVDQKWN